MPEVDFDTALAAVRARLTARSAAHSEAVAREAGRLAEIYRVDVESARLAGLLHDWARDEAKASLLTLAARLGVESASVDTTVPYLLHAKVGAAQLKTAFPGIAPEVLSAIERHTTAARQMSDLDMVVYVADMIEPARTFDGVDRLRAAVGAVALGELFARAYEVSLRHVIERRHHLHPTTVDVWNAIVERERP